MTSPPVAMTTKLQYFVMIDTVHTFSHYPSPPFSLPHNIQTLTYGLGHVTINYLQGFYIDAYHSNKYETLKIFLNTHGYQIFICRYVE